MKVLVACEYSGRVRDAFNAAGHDAMSCDLLPTETPGPHYQGDVFDVLYAGWDLMIGFPPCTHLSSAGARHWRAKKMNGHQAAGISFVRRLAAAPIPRIAIENPSGALSTAWRKPDQIVQPWWFGEPYTKTTCLWLTGLPLLTATDAVKATAAWVGGQPLGKPGLHGLHRNPHTRSLTFAGIAKAMANQWGSSSAAVLSEAAA